VSYCWGVFTLVAWNESREEDFPHCVGREYAKEIELRKKGEFRITLSTRPNVIAQRICRSSNREEWQEIRIDPEFKGSGVIPDWTKQDKQRAFELCVEKLTPRLLEEFEDQAPEKCRKLISEWR
jgi:hypothetical protein